MWDVTYFVESAMSQTKGIQAVTCGPITYIRNYKCASSFFYYNLIELYGWKEIKFEEINWNGKVFSHIRNPIDRRHRGLAHYIHHNHPEVVSNPEVFNILLDVPFVDAHSESHYSMFGDYCYNIDWIPLDNYSNTQIITWTSTLLHHYGQMTVYGFDPKWKNSRNNDELLVYHKIKDYFEKTWIDNRKNNIQRNYSVDRYWHKDLELYKEVITKFYGLGITWPEITWLKK